MDPGLNAPHTWVIGPIFKNHFFDVYCIFHNTIYVVSLIVIYVYILPSLF